MEFFANKEIVEKYNISQPTLFKWIKNAQQNKNNLVVQKVNKNYKIIKNEQNISELQKLYLEAQKFKNKIALEKITPSPEFFEIFSHRQIIEIINDLQVSKEINLKFSYLNKGAFYWHELASNKNYKNVSSISQILQNSVDFITSKMPKSHKINLIEIGTGDGSTTLNLIKTFQNKKLLNKYIAVDISVEMLKIAKTKLLANIENLELESYVRDIEETDIKEICFENKTEKVINILLFIDTIGNFNNQSHIWSNLYRSLGNEDLLIISNKLDRNQNKSDFSSPSLVVNLLLNVPRMLNLVEENSKIHYIFNEAKQARCAYLELAKDYILTIKTGKENFETVLKFQKGDLLEIWMHKLSTVQNLVKSLNSHQMEMIQLTTEKDGNHALVIAERL